MTKRIAVVGGGLTGIGCLAELVRAGHDVSMYERNDDIGGVWHPSNCYSGLALHGASAAFEYHDFPLPAGIDKSRPISSPQVFAYLRDYFRHAGLYARAEFNVAAEQVAYSRATGKSTLRLRHTGSDEVRQEEFDYVVYTHGFAARTLPHIKGADRFAGELLHSFDLSEEKLAELARTGRKVVVVGASKTATDMVLRFHRHRHPVTWLYRKNYWFMRSDVLIDIHARKAVGLSEGRFRRALLFAGDLIGTKAPRLHLALWRAFGLAHTFGPRHWDFTKYHRGRIEDAPMAILRECAARDSVIGEIASISRTGLVLKDGASVDCDTIVFCTGSSGHNSLLAVEKDGLPFDLKAVRRLYRARVIPEIPNVIFTAFHLFSFGVVNGLMTGKWIEKFIQGGFTEAYLAKHADLSKKPFFTGPSYLFDSSKAFNAGAAAMFEPFFKSGELSKKGYFTWLWQISFATEGVKPLELRSPVEVSLVAPAAATDRAVTQPI
jgi:dimethylaniline monooxygenase (N-oxide forming)